MHLLWIGKIICSMRGHRWKYYYTEESEPYLSGFLPVVDVHRCPRCGKTEPRTMNWGWKDGERVKAVLEQNNVTSQR